MSTFGGPWRLVVADLDGTLVTATTACVYLDGWIGHGPVIESLERRCAGGEITDTQVAESYAPFYRDIAVADVSAVMAQISSLDDIALGVSLLSGRGIDPVIATVSWSSSQRRPICGASPGYAAPIWRSTTPPACLLVVSAATASPRTRSLSSLSSVSASGSVWIRSWPSGMDDQTCRCFIPLGSALWPPRHHGAKSG